MNNPITYIQQYPVPESLPLSSEMVWSVSGGVPGAKFLVSTLEGMLNNLVAWRSTHAADFATRPRGEEFRELMRGAASNWLMNYPDAGRMDEVEDLVAQVGSIDDQWSDAYLKSQWEIFDRGSSEIPANFPPRPADYKPPRVKVSGPGSVTTVQPTEDKGTLLAGIIGPKKAFSEDGFDYYPAGAAAAENGKWKYKDGDQLVVGGKLYVASIQARPFQYLYFATPTGA